MTRLTIRPGLSGGETTVGGHKHSAVSVLAAAVATGARATIDNIARIEDTHVLAAILKQGGARVAFRDQALELDTSTVKSPQIPSQLSRLIHGSLYLVPAYLGRFGAVQFERFGGCPIGPGNGERPVEHVVDVLERFGAAFRITPSRGEGYAKRLRGTTVDIRDYSTEKDAWAGPYVSGATKTALLAAAAADGPSVVHYPYLKEETRALVDFLRGAGAVVDMEPTCIVVTPAAGQPSSMVGIELTSDLGEILTYLVASVLLNAPIRVRGRRFARARIGLAPELALLEAMGVEVTWEGDTVHARAPHRLRAVNFVVRNHTIYSDHQPLFALLLLRADSPSTIIDRVWTNRFGYAQELAKFGAGVEVDGDKLRITPSRLHAPGDPVVATDVRAAATLILAALASDGPCVVDGVEHLDRGYRALVGTLRLLGASLTVHEPVPAGWEQW